jgi:hypothetical protein
MNEWLEKFADRIFTQCGIVTSVLFVIVVYLMWQLNAERKEREDDREAWRQDLEWRMQTADSMRQTLAELDRGVRSLLEVKAVIFQSVKRSISQRKTTRKPPVS